MPNIKYLLSIHKNKLTTYFRCQFLLLCNTLTTIGSTKIIAIYDEWLTKYRQYTSVSGKTVRNQWTVLQMSIIIIYFFLFFPQNMVICQT